jgi:uncharacterized DUF497 family protein
LQPPQGFQPKSEALRLGLEEAQEILTRPYYQDQRSDDPEQQRAIGWAGDRLFTVIFEIREDGLGESWRLVTLWRATREEQELYVANS